MDTYQLHPFIRYAHLIPIDENTPTSRRIAYDHRFFYVCEKKVEFSALDTSYGLVAGDAVIISSGTEYRIEEGGRATLLGINFDFTDKFREKSAPIPLVDRDSYDDIHQLEGVIHPLLKDKITVIRGLSKCESRLFTILREYTEGVRFYEDMISHVFSEVLIECMRGGVSASKGGADTASRIIGYINENSSMHLTNEIIADALGLHPNYASAIIKEKTGMPIHKYLMKTRVCYSIDLLSTGKYSIREVAERCGFSDIYHFSKVFKKFTSLPPSKYLKSRI